MSLNKIILAPMSDEDKELVVDNELTAATIISELDRVCKFKEGDYLIAHYRQMPGLNESNKTYLTNSYGALKKFKVIHVDNNGIPYLKELDKNGRCFSDLILMFNAQSPNDLDYEPIYELDPDFADSIILDSSADYDPVSSIREKSKEFKEIAKHNKKIKVNTKDNSEYFKFMSNVKVGDILWRSNSNNVIVIEVNSVPLWSNTKKPMWGKTFIKVQNNKNTTLEISLDSWHHRALYTAQPRTYKGQYDPK